MQLLYCISKALNDKNVTLADLCMEKLRKNKFKLSFPNSAINKLMGQKYVCKLPGDNKNKGFAHGEMVSAMGKWIYVIPFPHGQIFFQPPDATFKE